MSARNPAGPASHGTGPIVRSRGRRDRSSAASQNPPSSEPDLASPPFVPQIETAPFDPRFPQTNQAKHCYTRYNEFHKCVYRPSRSQPRTQSSQQSSPSLCVTLRYFPLTGHFFLPATGARRSRVRTPRNARSTPSTTAPSAPRSGWRSGTRSARPAPGPAGTKAKHCVQTDFCDGHAVA